MNVMMGVEPSTGYLVPHPLDKYGKPPRIGEPYGMDPDGTDAQLDKWLALLSKANELADEAQGLEDEANDLRGEEEEAEQEARDIAEKVAVIHPEWAGLLKSEKDPRKAR